ncbi:MAG: hypothetical protein KY455_06255 [Euryarchaeota archaeon]|nr:hypothetical protein [Euryarchaeota archaeon]
MNRSIHRLALVSAGAWCLVFIAIVGAIAWVGFSAAEDVDAGRSDAADAAETLRLTSALLGVSIVFLTGLAAMIAVHVSAQVRAPLEELKGFLHRVRDGALAERLPPSGPADVQVLTEAANQIAETFLVRQRQERRMMTTDAIDALIAGIAHEVNTPVTSLTIDEELMYRHATQGKAENGEGDRLKKLHTRNVSGLHRLRELTRALGEVLRDDASGEGSDVDLVVRASLALTHHQLPAAVALDIRLEADKAGACRSSRLFHALHQVVLNIGGRVGTGGQVEIRTRADPRHVEILLRDDGTPLAEELVDVLENVEPMSGWDDASYDLLTSLSALRREGAHITVKSDDNWTSFRFRIPVVTAGVAAGTQILSAR